MMKKLIVLLMSFVFLTTHIIECATFINCTNYLVIVMRDQRVQCVAKGGVGDLGTRGLVQIKMPWNEANSITMSINVNDLKKQIYCLQLNNETYNLFFRELSLEIST